METCTRGFSFMPDNKVEVVDLQYIEEGELERTWKSTRRERLKQREQKIWEEFVKEKDIVNSVYEDDQYQFLEKLPEKYVKDIMESDLQKLKEDLKANEENKVRAQISSQEEKCSISSTSSEPDEQPCVTFAEDIDRNDSNMFHIFDEDQNEQSGVEDGLLNESLNSPSTVRERQTEQPPLDVSLERPSSDVNTSSTGKSSENVSNVIESSIYCAKVKDLRIKINNEILEIICSFDRRDIYSIEREDITRMIKRSAEFCARFNRIYMYQLQRQMHDIKRNNNLTLPFAKHTQFQSQMIRVVSLHQNLLQAFQVFHKAMEQTWCEKENVSAVRALVSTTRAASELCAGLTPPRDLPAGNLLYQDNVLSSCDKLEEFVGQYTVRCEQLLKGFGNINSDDRRRKDSQKSINKNKKRPIPQRSNTKTVSESDARLSMYSLDRLRLNTKQSSSKDMHAVGTSRTAVAIYSNNKTDKNEQQFKKKSPRCRRPLMRDPQAGRPRPRGPRPQRARDCDIRTMVEQVEPCTSSRETSPELVRRTKASTPRSSRTPRNNLYNIVRKSQTNTPRKIRQHSPKLARSPSPKMKSTLTNIFSDKQVLENIQLIPTNKVQSAKKKRLSKEEKELDAKICYGDGKTDLMVGSSQLRSAVPESTTSRSETANSPKHTPSKRLTELTVLPEPSPKTALPATPTGNKKESDRNKVIKAPEQCEVTKILKQICSGDASGNRTENSGNAKNAQLLCIQSSSPRPHPSTPQLLRILEETIQKKVPKSLQQKCEVRDIEKYRMNFNITEKVADNLFQYRTKFVQHMLTSPMYANSAVGKPWEMIGSISEQIIDEVLLNCVKEMELSNVLQELYKQETT